MGGVAYDSNNETTSSLIPFTFPGRYEDDFTQEDITWHAIPSTRRSPPGQSGFELHTQVRGIDYWSSGLDGLSTEDKDAALKVNLAEDLGRSSNCRVCEISGSLQCQFDEQDTTSDCVVYFELDLKTLWQGNDVSPTYLTLRTYVRGEELECKDEWLETGLRRLEEALPSGVELRCCHTCLYSDYSAGGSGILGMSCHRRAKDQYHAVKSKAEYWKVPVTEEVMETTYRV